MAYLNGSLTRAVSLRIPHDPHLGYGNQADTIACSGPTEGQVILDDSGRRSAIRVMGEPICYEASFPLVPGWTPDAHWDVDQYDSAAMDAAVRYSRTDEWAADYTYENLNTLAAVGRCWMLNEHGGLAAEDYARQTGPWSAWEKWDPFDFKTIIPDLANRGDDGWSVRRRRFLQPASYWPETNKQQGRLPHIIEVSFNGDAGPFHRLPAALDIDPYLCGVRIPMDDLRIIKDPSEAEDPTGGPVNFVTAYIRGKLRVQSERGHHVIDTGPYAVIRHPGYFAACLLFAGIALALGSWWTLALAGLGAGLLVVRIIYEERTLRAELPGYEEYTQRVRYRLVPGVW
jgi:hypothetical protein